ncbi:MAG: DUF368 domain-containing protein [Bacteroidales bacterium]|nr:DUF368 domain-containing protein [Bacteroidales bacterium]
MGAANVIPGVSGGTIAFITGFFERLINAIKSFNLTALKLLFKGKFKAFLKHIDFYFLLWLFLGIAIAIVSVAKLFEYLFEHYPIYLWSFFFGLVLASIVSVTIKIKKWSFSVILTYIIGTAIAVSISFLTPASQNDALWYLLLCGVVAVCSMILPGVSGSFVLILMGNYELVMIEAVTQFRLDILIPVIIGGGLGLIALSNFLSWVFKKFHDQTIAGISGFILGSLLIIWPWKSVKTELFGDIEKTVGYNWHLPEINAEMFIAISIIIVGILCVWVMERAASKKEKIDGN